MSDLQKYVAGRQDYDPSFKDDFDFGYDILKIGVLLRQAREDAGMTQDEVAAKLGTQKSVISRIENHADNVTLNTLKQYANAVGRRVQVHLVLS